MQQAAGRCNTNSGRGRLLGFLYLNQRGADLPQGENPFGFKGSSLISCSRVIREYGQKTREGQWGDPFISRERPVHFQSTLRSQLENFLEARSMETLSFSKKRP
jgi:hypothetical protein